jgi:hypothetical protein
MARRFRQFAGDANIFLRIYAKLQYKFWSILENPNLS